MKTRQLLTAAAVAAGMCTAPLVWAQASSSSTGSNTTSGASATDGRSGGAGVPSSSSGATPSTQPQQDMRTNSSGTMQRDRTTSRDRVHSGSSSTGTSPSGRVDRNPTDGRTGGTGTGSNAAPPTSPGYTGGTSR